MSSTLYVYVGPAIHVGKNVSDADVTESHRTDRQPSQQS